MLLLGSCREKFRRYSPAASSMSWRGADEDSHLWSSALTGSGWTPQSPLGDAFTSTHGPALAVAGPNVLIGWKDSQGDALLWSQLQGR